MMRAAFRLNTVAALCCTGLLLAATTGCLTENVVPEETETVIEGGTRVAVSPDGRLSVDFTRGSIAEGTRVTVGFADLNPTGLVGRAYRLGPDGLSFDGPVTVRFDVGDHQATGALVLANLDGPAPAVIQGSTYDPVAKTLTGNLEHFSNYGAIDVTAPCAGRACGEPCDSCAPDDTVCVGATTICDANGACVPGNPATVSCGGRNFDPCAGLACGDTCSLCPPGATDCIEPAVLLTCNANGQCGMNQPTCGAFLPCGGKVCGESCSLCPPDVAGCVEPDVLMTCDGFGACVYADPSLVDCGGPPPPSECGSDVECAPGEICVGEAWCPGCEDGDPNCDGACFSRGICLPMPGDPCIGKACGEECNPCDASDPSLGCPAVMGVCDSNGACVQPNPAGTVECGGVVPPPSCNADSDCAAGEACLPYEWCPPCTQSDPACAMPCYAGWGCQPANPDCAGAACGDVCVNVDGSLGYCDGQGGCLPQTGSVPPGCGPNYQPCGGKTCGDTCQLCDPADPSCVETDVVKWCDANGGCGYAFPVCDTNPPTSECQADSDCANGAYCVIETWCPPCANDPVFPCDAPCLAYGVCQDTGLPYEPCRGKTCGDNCTLCDPNDPTCAETEVIKSCDAWGQCAASVPACGVTGDFCGGFAGIPCAPGYVCVDDPRDSCDPATGADCSGVCEPDACLGGPIGCNRPCAADSDCFSGESCTNGICEALPVCPDGTPPDPNGGCGTCAAGDPACGLPCAADSDCAAGQACMNGVCQ